MITTVLASGLLMMPKPWKLLGLLTMPVFFHEKATLSTLFVLHENLCLSLLALVCLHLAAIAWHIHRGHPVLRRMTART